MKNLIILSFAFALLFSCKSATEKVKEDFMPIARGDADELILVIDSAHWSGAVGTEIKGIFQQYYRVLNQDEYEFNVNRINPRKINDIFLNARNLVFVMTLDSRSVESRAIREYFTDNSLKMIQKDTSIYYTVRKDEFAKGQTVLFLYGQNEEQITRHIAANKDALKEIFMSAVKERTREVVLTKLKDNLMKSITEGHGYHLDVPFGWDLAKELPDFLWLRKLDKNSELNIFIHERPFTDEQFYLKIDELRDEITTTYLRDAEKPDLYIARQQVVPTQITRLNFNGKFAAEARGLWKVSDISGGGPYVSYTFVDEKTQKMYYIEGYVYDPGSIKKKVKMRELEAILSTFRTASEFNSAQ